MNTLIYKNTKAPTDRGHDFHKKHPVGIAYQQDKHFIHIYGAADDLWEIHSVEIRHEKHKTLKDWVVETFGAEEIKNLSKVIGEAVHGVWRPGLYPTGKVSEALKIDEHEQRSAEQALKILLDKLDDLFLYIEPNQDGLKTFSHKTREFLILACTEVENIWQQYMKIAGLASSKKRLDTKDYVKLKAPLFLKEYEITLKTYKDVAPIRPFENWNSSKPTKSLSWYYAYNNTKHDRTSYFSEATLANCIHAIAANIVLFCVRYSPFPLLYGNNLLSAMINQHFKIKLIKPNPATFYIPKFILSDTIMKNDDVEPFATVEKMEAQQWHTKPLNIKE